MSAVKLRLLTLAAVASLSVGATAATAASGASVTPPPPAQQQPDDAKKIPFKGGNGLVYSLHKSVTLVQRNGKVYAARKGKLLVWYRPGTILRVGKKSFLVLSGGKLKPVKRVVGR